MIPAPRIQALRHLAQSFRNAPGSLGTHPAATQLAGFYDFLADLASGRLRSSSREDAGSDHLPLRFQALADRARDAFSQTTSREMAQKLRELREDLGNLAVWPEPEARLLHSVAESWWQHLQSPDTEPRLEIVLYPPLTLTGDAQPTIAVCNGSSIPVSDIEISFHSIPATPQPAGSNPLETRLSFNALFPGESALFRPGLDEGTLGRLEFRWQCSAIRNSGLQETAIDLGSPAEAKIRPEEDEGCVNPYLPDLPIDYEESWSELARGTHAALVRRILSEPTLRLGRVLSVHGLRRSGKTTILRRLAAELKHDPSLLPVYIDIYSWWLPLKHREQTIDGQGLLYELADSVLRTTWRLQLQTPRSEEFLHPFEEPGKLRMPFGDFERFLQRLGEDLQGRKPLFLLDELDSWMDELRFDQDSMALLRQLGDLAESRACSAVVAHTTSGARWRERFDRQIPEALVYRIELLRRVDIDALANLLPVPCTVWARELLWRLTGGWPGLLQSFLYMTYQDVVGDEATVETIQAQRVDMARVRRLLSGFLQSEDRRAYRDHLLGSFEADEKEALRKWIEIGALDTALGELHLSARASEQAQGVLDSLKGKEVFWPYLPVSERYRLRIGILGLLPLPAGDPLSMGRNSRP